MSKIYNIFNILFLLLNPFLGVIYSFINNKKINPLLLSLVIATFWGLAGYNLRIQDGTDISLYYAIYNGQIEENITNINIGDFYTTVLFNVLHSLNLSSKYISAVSAFFYFLFLSFIARLIYTSSNKQKFIFIFILLLFTHYPLLFTGLRYHHAILLYMIAVFSANKNIRISYVCLLLSLFFHFAMIPLVLLFIFSTKLNFRVVKKIAVIFIILAPFYIYIVEFIVSLLNGVGGVGTFLAAKITNYWLVNADRIIYPGSRFFVIQEFFAFSCVIYYLWRTHYVIKKQFGAFYINILILLISYSIFTISCFDLFFRTVELFNYFFIVLSLFLSSYSIRYSYLLYFYLLLGVIGNISDGSLFYIFNKETIFFSFYNL